MGAHRQAASSPERDGGRRAPGRSNEGEQLRYLELGNGVPVLAVDGGYSLPFIKDNIQEFREVDAPERGSQFRSRDHFPAHVAEVARGEPDSIGKERSLDDIPAKPETTVCHVDGYGNIKTSIRVSELDPTTDESTVEIESQSRKASIEDGVFEVEEDSVVLASGSAGVRIPTWRSSNEVGQRRKYSIDRALAIPSHSHGSRGGDRCTLLVLECGK